MDGLPVLQMDLAREALLNPISFATYSRSYPRNLITFDTCIETLLYSYGCKSSQFRRFNQEITKNKPYIKEKEKDNSNNNSNTNNDNNNNNDSDNKPKTKRNNSIRIE